MCPLRALPNRPNILIILDKRLNTLKNWLINELKLPILSIDVASADASFRRYFRITIDTDKNHNDNKLDHLPKTLIAMDSPPEHEDNALFISCTKKLEQYGLNIPTLYYQNLELGFLVIKDLGTCTYDQELDNNTADQLYHDATQALLKMQSQSTHSTKGQNNNHDEKGHEISHYNSAKLLAEMSLFENWYIKKYHQSTLSSKQHIALHRIYQLLVENALEQPQILVHRDYHCRNLLVTKHNNPGIIDYQDMLIGPITYDLVSLFKDCYIEWPQEKVRQWVLNFQQLALKHSLSTENSPSTWLRWFDLMGVQRHLKVLGIFCRLYYRDGKDQYLADLDITYRYLINTCQHYPELNSLAEVLLFHPVKTTIKTNA